ncbi:carnitine transporter [Geranomyces variabilis]|uniref:Carnitine transporter n=1 Tax=Geranomyces variabilis TaxID=109894 RepID=A0AAD5XV84_9FUNG|nr:carnitine transporter [Geranomyces variabilis]
MSDTVAVKEPPKMDQIKSLLGGGAAGSQQSSQGIHSTPLKSACRPAPTTAVWQTAAMNDWRHAHSYDLGCQLVRDLTPNRSKEDLTLPEYAIAGGFSAIPTTIVATPMERVKVILQTQDQSVGGKKYAGMADAAAGKWKEGGIRSLYRGTIATLGVEA